MLSTLALGILRAASTLANSFTTLVSRMHAHPPLDKYFYFCLLDRGHSRQHVQLSEITNTFRRLSYVGSDRGREMETSIADVWTSPLVRRSTVRDHLPSDIRNSLVLQHIVSRNTFGMKLGPGLINQAFEFLLTSIPDIRYKGRAGSPNSTRSHTHLTTIPRLEARSPREEEINLGLGE